MTTYTINVYRRLSDGKPYTEAFARFDEAQTDFYLDDWWRGTMDYVHTVHCQEGKITVVNFDDPRVSRAFAVDFAAEAKHETGLRNWRSM